MPGVPKEEAVQNPGRSAMLVAGMHRSTLVDFPGKVACSLFTQGCNMRCPWCHNHKLIPGKSQASSFFLDTVNICNVILTRSSLLDGIVISGGEPLIHKDLEPLLRRFRTTKLLIKLDTNGSYPKRLEALLDANLVDYVAMDLKAVPDNRLDYAYVTGGFRNTASITKSIEIIAAKAPEAEYRTTVLPGFHSLEMLSEMADKLPDRWPYYLQLFTPRDAWKKEWRNALEWTDKKLKALATTLAAEHPTKTIRARAHR